MSTPILTPPNRIKNHIGQRFGKLLVISYCAKDKWGDSIWLCQCDCGGNATPSGNNLRKGNSTSCGCKSIEYRKSQATHGMSGTPQYMLWHRMTRRCCSTASPDYPDYGGRGISVCDRWRNFEGFYTDMGDCPAGKSIDRIDNDGNYEPDNCKWSTPGEQARNRRIQNSNKSGVSGVTFCNSTGKWVAGISYEGSRINLGRHTSFLSACCARKSAELKYWHV